MFNEGNFGEIHIPQEAIKSGKEKMKERASVQKKLATELYEYMFGETEAHDDIMDYWVGDAHPDGYAAKFAQLEKDPLFINHPRLKGDISKLTLQDMIQYKQEGTLPLEIEEESVYRN